MLLNVKFKESFRDIAKLMILMNVLLEKMFLLQKMKETFKLLFKLIILAFKESRN